uniref:Alpha/beta hydrolase n=1 Tax=Macrostomum lignano TaxID=282301 RepID=A0A1I8HFI6_9PLAT
EQQDVLNRLGAVALGPDHVARQLKSSPAQTDGRALQLGPIVQGLGPDALDGFDHHLPQPSTLLVVGQRFGLEDGSDRTKGRPGKSSAPPEVLFHVGHQTAEDEPLAACELWSSARLRRGTSGPLGYRPAQSAPRSSAC